MIRAGVLILALLSAPAIAGAPVATLTWKVKEGNGIFGYIIYRAEHRQGPYMRASKQIVRRDKTVGSGDASVQYQFVDRNVVEGQTYYYFIDVVAVSGKKQRLSGVQQRTVGGK